MVATVMSIALAYMTAAAVVTAAVVQPRVAPLRASSIVMAQPGGSRQPGGGPRQAPSQKRRTGAKSGGAARREGAGGGAPRGGGPRSGAPRRGSSTSPARAAGGRPSSPPRPKRQRAPKAPALPSCYGCGASLQTEYDDVPGYVDAALFEEKRVHRQLDQLLCSRCRLLAQGEFIPVVREGSTDLAGGRSVITPQQLRDQLKGLADRAALIVKLVDMVDVSGTFLTRVRNLVGRNPVILVGTKADLLPRGTDDELVCAWLRQLCEAHSLNVIDVHLVSARTGAAVERAVRAICSQRKGRDVFVLGAANVGKSMFIKAMLKQLARRDPSVLALAKRQPMASATPGTTLGIIPIDAFSGGSKLHDTPGVHLHHRVTARLPPADIKALTVRSPLRGVAAPVSDRLGAGLAAGLRGRQLEEEAGWSVLWGAFLRVDVVRAPPCMRLVFFGPEATTLSAVDTADAAAHYAAGAGSTLTPPLSRDALGGLGEFEEKRTLRVRVAPGERALDVAVSGLGWFSVVGVAQSGLGGEAELALWAPRAVELFARKPMPVPWEDFVQSGADEWEELDDDDVDDDDDDFGGGLG